MTSKTGCFAAILLYAAAAATWWWFGTAWGILAVTTVSFLIGIAAIKMTDDGDCCEMTGEEFEEFIENARKGIYEGKEDNAGKKQGAEGED